MNSGMRALLAGFALLVTAGWALPAAGQAPAPRAAATDGAWSYEVFQAAVKASQRKFAVGRETFERIQVRKANAVKGIERYLADRFGVADPAVVKAFEEVPREYYHFQYAQQRDFAAESYEERAKPWAIGYGSALSDYLGQAYMTQLAKPGPNDVVLEIGTGSGFQISLLSRIVKRAYSIEIIQPLGQGVSKVFAPLGYDNIETRVGDGYFGWPEVKGGFDIIMVTCAAQYVPPPLFEQLKPGGRLIIPISQPFKRGQVLYVYTKDKQGKIHSRKDVGVYFIPMTGEQMRAKPPEGAAPEAEPKPAAPAAQPAGKRQA
ncbi:MAG: protein-L-isoaspartate O-methyltransferase [Candidatus Lambdaproteobacteria bacterium]|nr:protein-L-isoaspartate O-methyltransferase [Candidatus Lambdaproteobacteria bacterium]